MKAWISILIIALAAGHAAAKGPLIASGHPEYPPVMWSDDGKMTGAAVELTSAVFNQLGISVDAKATGPWGRVQENARKGSIDVIVAAYKNSERLEYMDYSIPFMEDPVVIFVMKGCSFPFKQWSDLRDKKGVTARGESYGEAFDRYIEEHLQVTRTNKTEDVFKFLEEKRADYAILGYYPGKISATQYGYDSKVEILPVHVVKEQFYITISHKSKYRSYLPRVNQLIKNFKEKGQVEQWLNEYFDLYQNSKQ